MVCMQRSLAALGSLSIAFSWEICSDASHYSGSNTVNLAIDGVKYTCDQWKNDNPSFTPTLESCSSKMPTVSQGGEGLYALYWFNIVRNDCCGTGNEVVCDQHVLWDPCTPMATYTPDNFVAAWKDPATDTDTKCSEGLFYYQMPKFVPSEAECAKTDVDLEGKSVSKRRDVLLQMSAECCGAAKKDVCADHWPEAPQLCAGPDEFQESPLVPGWQGATCGYAQQYYFSEMFTVSSSTCKEIVGPEENRYARDALLAEMSEACCGAPGMDVCSQLATKTIENTTTASDSAVCFAASTIPLVLVGLMAF